jgi:hypothetical protein
MKRYAERTRPQRENAKVGVADCTCPTSQILVPKGSIAGLLLSFVKRSGACMATTEPLSAIQKEPFRLMPAI